MKGKRIMMLLGPRYQDQEAAEPLDFLKKNGAQVDVVGLRKGRLKGLYGKADIEVNETVDDLDAEKYDALVIPGGKSPANLRGNDRAVGLVRDFFATGKPVAAICHGPQMLASAGVLEGRKITGYPGIEDEMSEAGAEFVDEKVVVDDNLITSRVPDDIPYFNEAIERAID